MHKKKLLLFSPGKNLASETFVRSHIENLPFIVTPIFGVKWGLCDKRGNKLFPLMYWLGRFTERVAPGVDEFLFRHLLSAQLRKVRPDYIFAEFGTTAAWLVGACRVAKLPLYVIFHGFDASVHEVLEKNKKKYEEVFYYASGIIAVSKKIQEKLVSLGAPEKNIRWSPCGVDPENFKLGDPEKSPPVFFGVGRFVEKKAPYLTILAFKRVVDKFPEAKLRIVGNGPLFGPCKRLVQALGINESVTLLGPCPQETVANEMQNARAFVQHSLVAEDGDSEGTPVAVIEAQMSGLPVISTNHAGIPDVVIDQETGFLVQEGDFETMATRMQELIENPRLARELGRRGRERAVANFSINHHINDITNMIANASSHKDCRGN